MRDAPSIAVSALCWLCVVGVLVWVALFAAIVTAL